MSNIEQDYLWAPPSQDATPAPPVEVVVAESKRSRGVFTIVGILIVAIAVVVGVGIGMTKNSGSSSKNIVSTGTGSSSTSTGGCQASCYDAPSPSVSDDSEAATFGPGSAFAARIQGDVCTLVDGGYSITDIVQGLATKGTVVNASARAAIRADMAKC